MAAESNGGISRLANVMTHRIKKQSESPLVLDFGSILQDKSLLTNTFPVKIPKGEYSVCSKARLLESGDRVLVAWVQSEAVVIDLLEKS